MSKKILIVEDEPYLSEMYKLKFEHEGYQVFIAEDGEIGLVLAKSKQPDLILLDLVMPKLDGYQTLKKLKKGANTKNIPVYILSNLGQRDEIKRGLDDGADGYLIKANVTPSQLADRVNKLINGKKKKNS